MAVGAVRRGAVALAMLGLALLASCNGDGAGSEGAGPPPAETTAAPSTTTTTVDVRVVPAVIDVAYLQRVMDVLDGLLHQAALAAAQDRSLGEAFQIPMYSLYSKDAVGPQLQAWRRNVQRVSARPGRPTTRVLEVLSASQSCVFFTAERDISPMATAPVQATQPYYLTLERDEPDRRNPTPWVIGLDTFFSDGSRPPDQCRQ